MYNKNASLEIFRSKDLFFIYYIDKLHLKIIDEKKFNMTFFFYKKRLHSSSFSNYSL